MKKFLIAALALIPVVLFAQTSPNWPTGYRPTAAEWNALWASKLDVTSSSLINPIITNPTITGGTISGATISTSAFSAGAVSATTLAASGAVTLSPGANVAISPTGVLTVAPTGASTINNASLGQTTPLAVKSTALTATGAVSLSPASANVVLSPTGTGVVTVNPATAGTLDNVSLGQSTPLAVTSTALTATGAVSLSPASSNVVLSPTGTGVVTINPATAGTINNASIGVTTPLAGKFTTLASTSAFTPSSTNGIVGTTTNDNANAGAIGEYRSSVSNGSSATVTITIASPAVITYTAHGASELQAVTFTTSSALPTGITAGTNYWMTLGTVTANTFQISTSMANAVAGVAVNTSGSQSGTQTGILAHQASSTVARDIGGLNLTAGDWDVDGTVATDPAGSTVTARFAGWIGTTSAIGGSLPAGSNSGGYANIPAAGTGTTFSLSTGAKRISISSTTVVYLSGFLNFSTSTATLYGTIRARRVR